MGGFSDSASWVCHGSQGFSAVDEETWAGGAYLWGRVLLTVVAEARSFKEPLQFCHSPTLYISPFSPHFHSSPSLLVPTGKIPLPQ